MPVSVVAAWVFCAFVAILTIIQVAAIAGAPLGAYLWGGETPGKLSPKLRRSSVISVLIYLVFVVLVLNRVAVLQLFSGFWAGFAAWVVFVFITLGLFSNLSSNSKREQALMLPLMLGLTLSSLLVALGI